MFLLDTNVVSELRKGMRADAMVRAWAQRQAAESLWLSAVTIMELELGILRVARRDAGQADRLHGWLEGQVMVQFQGRILPVDVAVARRAAALHVPDPRGERDALIGATGLVHGLVVVTRNVRDFGGMGAVLCNPWQG